MKYLHGLTSKTSFFHSCHQTSYGEQPNCGFLSLQQIGVCLLFCFQNKLIVFQTIRTEEMASRLKKHFVKSECSHHPTSTGIFCFCCSFLFHPSFLQPAVRSLFFEYQIACQVTDMMDLRFRQTKCRWGELKSILHNFNYCVPIIHFYSFTYLITFLAILDNF